MEEYGYDFEDSEIKDVLRAINKYAHGDTAVTAGQLAKKLQNGKCYFCSLSDLAKYDDKTDILADYGDIFYFGDSHKYITITFSGKNYYAKSFLKPFPYKELNAVYGDYKVSEDDPYKFERV